MLNRLPSKVILRLLLPVVLMTAGVTSSMSQSGCGFTQLKALRISYDEPIDPQGFFNGLMAFLPDDYGTNTAATYPVFIYFHGNGAVGDGSADQLCRIFTDVSTSLPNRLQNGDWPSTIQPGGVGAPTKYIVIVPQYDFYLYPSNYPSGNAVEAVINHVAANFRIRPNQIYLTGMSSGANMVMEYAGSSADRAGRVAGISLSSLCSPLSNEPQGGRRIGEAGLPVWMIHCQTDGGCSIQNPTDWYNQINANEHPSDGSNPVFTILGSPSNPPCNGFAHDTWQNLYNPSFRVNGMNLFEWSLQSTATLPVTFGPFDARSLNGKVLLKWSTLNETGNASFTIERSADGRNFSSLGSLKGNGNSTTEKLYEFVDDRPLANMNYYRLLQSDNTGAKNYSIVKKVLNRTANSKRLLVSPNPVTTELSAFIQLDKKQNVQITLTDMNGRRITQFNKLFDPGNTEFTIPTASLNKGIYLLKVTGETISETQKVIRQ